MFKIRIAMKFISSLLFSLISLTLLSQEYWQQEVNYKIQVELDDVNHKLIAFEEFEYINHSPDVISEIYIHLWPNAYKNEKTALGNQTYQSGDDYLKFGADSIKGSIDNLDFQVNGNKAKWEYDSQHIDICKIVLETPLSSGESVKISTPFTVKIPSGNISRLGHIGQSYQITQWYPKPAVYDKNGWNPIPYLNQGEFYSEYGSFDVSITLPENYVVGATGDLQTQSEIEFMDALAIKTNNELTKGPSKTFRAEDTPFPSSYTKKKTIRYTQNRVHDFAWFADKRYKVLKGEVELPHSGRKVTSWALFTPQNENLWKNSIEYINDGTYYYSLWNGDYPYNQVTAVDGTISAGGGMEYPNVTVIGNASSERELEVVIVHEVGHNWFYGILGSNERVHGWMDEGLNTLNEVRYMQTKYPNNTAFSDMVLNGSFHLDHLNHRDMGDISYRMLAVLGEDQPIETHSADFTSINYGVIMYQKTGLVFNYLQEYLGEELFDKCMQNYFEEWKFKHPQPEDIRASIEKTAGRSMDWFFGDLIQTTNHPDYKITKVKNTGSNLEVTVKNKGQVDGPIPVYSYEGDNLYDYHIIEPGSKKTTITIGNATTTKVIIDPYKNVPEVNRTNNVWDKNSGLFKRTEKPTFEFLFGDHETEKSNIFWTPVFGLNAYDKFMLGAAFHNYGIPFNQFQYLIAPMYSFGRNSLSGISETSYSFLPKKGLKLSKIGLSIKTFKHDSTFTRNASYFAIASPYWSAKIGNRTKASPWSNTIRLQGMYRYDQFGSLNADHAGGFLRFNNQFKKRDLEWLNEFRTDYASNVNNADQFGRSSVESTIKYRYIQKKKGHWISLRGYAGMYWLNDFKSNFNSMYVLSANGSNGTQDIFVEDYYFGRTMNSGIWSQQRGDNMGNIHSTSDAGIANELLLTYNFYLQLPIRPNIFGVYVDGGTAVNEGFATPLFATGIALKLGDVFGVYFPIYQNDYLELGYLSKDYKERIRFTLKLNLFNRSLDLGNFM